MKRCFVIQPFDKGEFDRRYDETLVDAIRDAGLEPYRVDRDHSVDVPIESIEREIQAATACLADITNDNPNVWFEVGYALAQSKPICMICNNTRPKFPFDIQHRKVIRYGTGSPSDFQELKSEVTSRLQHYVSRAELTQEIPSQLVLSTNSLQQHELALLILAVTNLHRDEEGMAVQILVNEMGDLGFNELATSLAIRNMSKRNLISTTRNESFDNHTTYTCVKPTELGIEHVANLPNLDLKKKQTQARRSRRDTFDRDDIPF